MAFQGFPKEGVRWFKALARAQDREWFQANKAGYEQLWKAPMEALLQELHGPLGKVYGRELPPPKVFRLNRDVRFSKDKSPYKTNIAATIPLSGGSAMEGATALYLSLGLQEMVAFGFYALEPSGVGRLREGLLDEKAGKPLDAALKKAHGKGLTPTAMEQLKRVPPGVAKDHPRAELLKLKGLALSTSHIPEDVRHTADLKAWVVTMAKAAAPVVAWGEARHLAG